MSAIIRSPLNWMGTKRKHVDWLFSMFPTEEDGVIHFIDACGGSAVVALNAGYRRVTYNDIDGDVVHFFRVLQKHHNELYHLIYYTPCAREEHSLALQPVNDDIERARRFMVVNDLSFAPAKMYRAMKADSKIRWTPAEEWIRQVKHLGAPSFVEKIRGMEIENMDVFEIIKTYSSPHALIYIDPPYPSNVRSKNSEGALYSHEATSWEWHEELAKRCDESNSKIAVSCYDDDRYASLFDGWNKHASKQYFTTAGSKLKPRQEMLLTNYELHQPKLL